MEAQARRTGLVAQKLGMTQIFDEFGQSIGVTLLKADENVVLNVKTKEKDGYNAVVMGFGKAKPNRVSKARKGICAKAKAEPVKIMKEFRVAEDALLKAGQKLAVNHFVEDQLVDVEGTSIGKGFAGAMKRHNFGGLEATHGVSISHRSHGSTGQCQDPGKVFKGKKMAGHMGNAKVTTQNITVAQIDPEMGIIALEGSVPGPKGSYVFIKDAIKVALPGDVAYPASIVDANDESAKEAKPEEAEAPKEEAKVEEPKQEAKPEAEAPAAEKKEEPKADDKAAEASSDDNK